ncbi:MAG TPA: alanine--tRNA ligase, partial [Oceanospirillales bacterium]|nr:alanine--tRNA ligase [Oceanospirillales bacterium]
PKPCVDTGMGLERISSIMQGKHNNYDIDLFQHIIKFTAELLKFDDLSNPSLKVIADHIRTCSFLICDGILPSNEGRGYVLRRIIRRAIRHGYKLGATDTFFYKILTPLIDVMADAYPELLTHKEKIEKALQKEELRFAETLETGMAILNTAIADLSDKTIAGEVAFKLYDTYGFPLDLTQDVAREQGLTVDVQGFEQCMQQQKQRSKATGSFAQTNQLPTELIAKIQATKFTGYKHLSGQGEIIALVKDGKAVEQLAVGESGVVILDETPFYAESGGQVGDSGKIISNDQAITVLDTQKGAGQFHLHIIENTAVELKVRQVVQAQVDELRRNAIILNHSATHLLHKVLQEQLGSHVQQKGSIVASDKLRFDFSHAEAITATQLQRIEDEVNKRIRANYQAKTQIMSYDDAVKTGAVALFGEKYGDEVRVLNIGDYSIELCGGTHVQNAGQIGLFKIVSEASIAAGVRRIEAVTGKVAIDYIQSCEERYNNLIQLVHASDNTVVEKVEQILQNNKQLEK